MEDVAFGEIYMPLNIALLGGREYAHFVIALPHAYFN